VFAVDRVLNIAYVYVLVYHIAFSTLAAEDVVGGKYPTRTGHVTQIIVLPRVAQK